MVNAKLVEQPVVITDEVDRPRPAKDEGAPINDVLPKVRNVLAVAEYGVQSHDTPIEIGGAKLSIGLISPRAVDEPRVDLRDERDFRLQEETRAAGCAVGNPVGSQSLDEGRRRCSDRPKQDRDVPVLPTLRLQPLDGLGDTLGFIQVCRR